MFLIRDDSYVDTIKDEKIKQEFVDGLQPIAKEKLVKLKREIGKDSRYNISVLSFYYLNSEKKLNTQKKQEKKQQIWKARRCEVECHHFDLILGSSHMTSKQHHLRSRANPRGGNWVRNPPPPKKKEEK